MNLIKKLGILSAFLISFYTFLIIYNNHKNNHEFRDEDKDNNEIFSLISRADGAFGFTRFIHYGDKNENYIHDEIHKKEFFKYYFYSDGGMDGKNDGLVDRIEIFYPSRKIIIKQKIYFFSDSKRFVLEREKDYKNNPQEFEDADFYLNQTKKRFENI